MILYSRPRRKLCKLFAFLHACSFFLSLAPCDVKEKVNEKMRVGEKFTIIKVGGETNVRESFFIQQDEGKPYREKGAK